MRSRPFALAAFAFCMALACSREPSDVGAVVPAAPARTRALVFAGGDGPEHGATLDVAEAIARVAREQGLDASVSTDASALDERELALQRLLVFVHTSGARLSARARSEVRRYVQAGGGVVVVHASLSHHNDWGFVRRLAGVARATHGPERTRDVAGLPLVSGWHALGVLFEGSEVELVDRDGEPIAWRRAVEGARVFATDLGHDASSLEHPAARDALRNGLGWASGDGAPLDYARAMPPAGSLAKQVLATNVSEPVALAPLPGGGVLVAQRRGAVGTWLPGESELRPALTIAVDHDFEYGLLGVALDASFERTGFLYLLATKPREGGLPRRQRVARYVYDAAARTIDPASERALLEIPLDPEGAIHAGGALAVDGSGLLIIATGDDTQPARSGGYAPLDDSPGGSRYDAARSAGNAADLRGKLLRIRPNDDGSFSIPDGNLFGTSSAPGAGRPEIYAMGLRNPFTLALDAQTGAVFVASPGPDAARDDALRGPRGYDEIERVVRAANLGWPYFGGDGSAYGPVKQDAAAPNNASPNNTGPRTLPPAQPPWLAYPYAHSNRFPELGRGPRSVFVGGVADGRLPGERRLLVGDFMRGTLHWLGIDAQGEAGRVEPVAPGVSWRSPVNAAIGDDGAIYVLEYGTGWYRENEDAQLSRLVPADPGSQSVENEPAARVPEPALDRFIALRGNASLHRDGEIAWRAVDAAPSDSLSVSARYVESRGEERAMRALEQNGCSSCHVDLVALAGEGSGAPPSVAALRERYADPSDALLAKLADKVERGGAGSFGEAAMPPQSGVDRATLLRMLRHWLAPAREAPVHRLAQSKPTRLRDHEAHALETRVGRLVRGGYRVAVEVDGSEVAARTLRAQRFPADEYDEAAGVELRALGGGVDAVIAAEEGAWIRFDAIDLRGLRAIDVLAVGHATASGARIELRLDAPGGEAIGPAQELDFRRASEARLSFGPVDVRASRSGANVRDLYVVARRGRARELVGLVGLELVAGDAAH